MAKHNIAHSLLKSFSLCLSVVLGLFSCKKTETVGLPTLPQDRMLEYKVTNLPDTVIYGAIDNIENTVTVYLPYYYAVSHLDPEIKVQPGATLEGEILPVHVLETKQHYTVHGADGNNRTYALQIVQQNPLGFSVDFNTPEASTPFGYPKNKRFVIGDFYSTSTATLKIKMTHQHTGKIFRLEGDDLHDVKITADTRSYTLGFPVPFDADSGYYDVEMEFLGNTAQITRPLKVEYKKPRVRGSIMRVTQGGTLLLESDNNTVFLGMTKATVKLKNGTEYNLPIIGNPDRLRAELKIPDDMPIGSHGKIPFHFTYEDWPGIVVENMTFAVTENNVTNN